MLQRNSDQLFHFFGGQSERFGLDFDVRRREFGQHVHGHVAKLDDPKDHHDCGENNHQVSEFYDRTHEMTSLHLPKRR